MVASSGGGHHWSRDSPVAGWREVLRTASGEAVTDLRNLMDQCELVYKYTIDTQWVGADAAPRCALECIALDVFKFHVQGFKDFDPANSGAEWCVFQLSESRLTIAAGGCKCVTISSEELIIALVFTGTGTLTPNCRCVNTTLLAWHAIIRTEGFGLPEHS